MKNNCYYNIKQTQITLVYDINMYKYRLIWEKVNLIMNKWDIIKIALGLRTYNLDPIMILFLILVEILNI